MSGIEIREGAEKVSCENSLVQITSTCSKNMYADMQRPVATQCCQPKVTNFFALGTVRAMLG